MLTGRSQNLSSGQGSGSFCFTIQFHNVATRAAWREMNDEGFPEFAFFPMGFVDITTSSPPFSRLYQEEQNFEIHEEMLIAV